MSSDYALPPEQPGPQPHPYLHDPLLHISGLPPYVKDEDLAVAFQQCAPFRPNISRDGSNRPLSGTIEFRYLEKAEKALATLQSRPIPGLHPPVLLVLSPYPSTTPPTPLPPPQASPRLVKHLPQGFTDSQLYDLFRPYGALASARTQAPFGKDTGVIEFWREEDAREAEEALHCLEIEGSNIAVQVYQPRRAGTGASGTTGAGGLGGSSEFSPTAPSFVPSGSVFSSPTLTGGTIPMSPYSAAASIGMGLGGMGQTQYSPPRSNPYSPRPQQVFVHGPGQQVQLAPLSGPGSSSHSGLIDPCNLFIKNLDTSIDSNGLFTQFRQYGQIVSARVMRNEQGESRGFGFVSYQTPDQASAAMHAMNGVIIGSKQLVVRLHEPKQLRQEKLAQRFGGHNGHPRSSSGATSPTASEAGESYAGWPSPSHRASVLGSPIMGGHGHGHGGDGRHDRARRSSGSYYHAALQGTLNLPMRYDDLSALSPVVRKEVLSGELSRRIKGMDVVSTGDLDAVVDSIVSLSLSEVVQGIQDPNKLGDQVQAAKKALNITSPPPVAATTSTTTATASTVTATVKEPSPTTVIPQEKSAPVSTSPSPSNSQDSRVLDANALNATASAPDHPSTPVSLPATLSTPPRTESPSAGGVMSGVLGGGLGSGSGFGGGSERDRMANAVAKLEKSQREELVELLMSLPKRERAMCLFNVEVLRAKIADAKMVLEVDDDEDGDRGLDENNSGNNSGGAGNDGGATAVMPTPVTPQARKVASVGYGSYSPQTPELSSRGPSLNASPTPVTPSGPSSIAAISSSSASASATVYTIATLAKMPAAEIIRLAGGGLTGGAGLPKADPLVVRATDEFVDGLMDKPVQMQKQQLGDKLWRVVKAFGIKGAPKITIALLDQEDLRPLAHLMNSYPAVLKEKALLVQAATTK